MISARYRIVASSNPGVRLEYANDIESAKSIAESIDGTIQIYVFGIGWVLWSEKMEGDL